MVRFKSIGIKIKSLIIHEAMTVSERPARHRPALRDSGEAGGRYLKKIPLAFDMAKYIRIGSGLCIKPRPSRKALNFWGPSIQNLAPLRPAIGKLE